ncbi:MAG: 3-oxoacyl-ACP reductase family protein [Candidatus Thorarchaeota archaeon]|jgi:3-oxoacyl-[acyl-carrier protein] reductase
MKLKERVALVTGASRGLGAAVSLALAREGADVIVNYLRSPDSANEVVEEIGKTGQRALAIQADVRDSDAVNEMINAVIENFGRLDILVNNACMYSDSTVWKMSDEKWEEVLDICLSGSFKCTRSAIPHMRNQGYGRIVNISSVVGQIGVFGTSNYSAAKAGLFGFTKAVAKEVARKGVTVNVLTLGYFEVGMLLRLPEEVQETIRKQIPIGRFGTKEEFTETVLFLVSELSSYLTGQVIHLNGGFYM